MQKSDKQTVDLYYHIKSIFKPDFSEIDFQKSKDTELIINDSVPILLNKGS